MFTKYKNRFIVVGVGRDGNGNEEIGICSVERHPNCIVPKRFSQILYITTTDKCNKATASKAIEGLSLHHAVTRRMEKQSGPSLTSEQCSALLDNGPRKNTPVPDLAGLQAGKLITGTGELTFDGKSVEGRIVSIDEVAILKGSPFNRELTSRWLPSDEFLAQRKEARKYVTFPTRTAKVGTFTQEFRVKIRSSNGSALSRVANLCAGRDLDGLKAFKTSSGEIVHDYLVRREREAEQRRVQRKVQNSK